MFWQIKKYYNIFLLLAVVVCAFIGYQYFSFQKTLQKSPMVAKLGKEYNVITSSDIVPKAIAQDQVHVIEFFSYDCSMCRAIQAKMQKKYHNALNYIKFEQIPVGDREKDKLLERFHYLLTMLGKNASNCIFNFLDQQSNANINSTQFQQWLLKENISNTDYNTANNFSAGIDAQITRSHTLQKMYDAENDSDIPFFVIGGRYQTNIGMVNGNSERLFEVIDQLIYKVKQGED